MKTPEIVSPEHWEAARQKLLVKEKELTRARDALPVLQHEQWGQRREGIRLRLVVVRVIGRLLVAARSRAQGSDAELLHHLPMVVGRRPLLRVGGHGRARRRRRRGGLLCAERRGEEHDGHDRARGGASHARAMRPSVGERSDTEFSHR